MKLSIQIKRITYLSFAIALSILPSACTRRPIFLLSNAVRIELHNDYTEPCEKTKGTPYSYKVLFFDDEGKGFQYEDFCSEKGGPVQGVPGCYTLYIHDQDNHTTLFDGKDSLHTYRAYTEEESIKTKNLFTRCRTAYLTKAVLEGINLMGTKGEPGFEGEMVIKQPDALFAGRKDNTDIPYLSYEDPDYIIPVDTGFALCQGTITITGITNTENIATIRVFITNLARGRYIGIQKPQLIPATIHVGITDITEERVYGVYNHFGKLDGYRNTAYIVIYDTSGAGYLFVEDISDQIAGQNDNANLNMHISFNVPAPETGGTGFQPEMNDWEIVFESVTIGK